MSGWIDVACALCGSLEREARFREGPWTVMSCGRCGLVYVTPRLDDDELVERVYDDSYWCSPEVRERGYADYRADRALQRRTFERRLRALEPQLPSRGRALDVGCATGAFLELLRDRGFEVQGVEPSPSAHADAALRLGAGRVLCATLEEAGLTEGRFDLISMWDLLGRLPRPLRTLRLARRLLAPGGRLVLGTPDVGSLAARLLGRRWRHYRHAEALCHYDAGTLARALAEAGLEPLVRTRRGAGRHLAPGPLRDSGTALYVNAHDEWIVVARALESGASAAPAAQPSPDPGSSSGCVGSPRSRCSA